MESKIYLCNVYHSRVNPIKHTFSYSLYYFVLDLDELENGKLDNPLFGYNKNRIISIKRSNYMGKDTTKSIKQKVINQLKSHQNKLRQEQEKEDKQDHDDDDDHDEKIENKKQTKFYNENILNINVNSINSIQLITNPSYFNYQFNPVNFYYCLDENKQLVQIVVEINNTFGETHLYYPSPTEFKESELKYPFKYSVDNNPYLKRYSSSKDFHVSPFNSLDGAYDFYFSDIIVNKCFDIRINLMSSLNDLNLNTLNDNGNDNMTIKQYDYIILTRLWSIEKPLAVTMFNISKILVMYPITTFMTLPRILYQAGKLHWEKKLKIYSKPNPPLENNTILIKPSANELGAMNFFLEFLNQFKSIITITLNLPDGQIISIDNRKEIENKDGNDGGDTDEMINIEIKNYEFFWKLFIMNKTTNKLSRGFSLKAIGMAYMCEDFKCNNLPKLLNQLCDLSINSSGGVGTHNNHFYENQNERKKIWSDISEFINYQNLYSLFLFNNNYQVQTPYYWLPHSSSCLSPFENIIKQLNITKHSNDMILEIEPNIEGGLNFSDYLNENGYLVNNRLIILIKSKESYDNYSTTMTSPSSLVDNQSNVTILNMDFNSFSNLSENKNKFDKILLIESLGNDLSCDSIPTTSYKSLLKSNNNSRLYIQKFKFYHNNNNNNKKPIRSSSFKNNYYKMIDQAGKKYWAIMADFQHNPFYLESRYLDLMKLLNKNSLILNGHIYDENDHHDGDDDDKDTEFDTDEINDNCQLFQLNNEILDNKKVLIPTIENWIKQCNNNQKLFYLKIQENAIKQGCLSKMNICEINEIYRGSIFYLSYLLATFNYTQNWSIQYKLYEKK